MNNDINNSMNNDEAIDQEIETKEEGNGETTTILENESTPIEESEAITEEKNSKIKKEEKSKEKKKGKGIPFLHYFFANLADLIAISALTFIVDIILKLAMKLFGYQFLEGTDVVVYGICFIAILILYAPICAKTGLKATIGQKLFYLRLEKDNN